MALLKKMAHGTRRRIAKVMSGLAETFKADPVEPSPPRRAWRRPRLLEICTWTCMVTASACARGWEAWQPITLECGFDLCTKKGQDEADRCIDKVDPDAIVMAFPCTAWSVLNENLNQNTEKQREQLAARRAQQRNLTRWMEQLAERCKK